MARGVETIAVLSGPAFTTGALLVVVVEPVDPVDPVDPEDPVDPVDPVTPVNAFTASASSVEPSLYHTLAWKV